MRWLWSSVDRWGPGAIAVVTLLAVIWYGRTMEGELRTVRVILAERSDVEASLRSDIQLWQAYVISLQKRMIEAGIQVPEAPRPVEIRRRKGRTEIRTP